MAIHICGGLLLKRHVLQQLQPSSNLTALTDPQSFLQTAPPTCSNGFNEEQNPKEEENFPSRSHKSVPWHVLRPTPTAPGPLACRQRAPHPPQEGTRARRGRRGRRRGEATKRSTERRRRRRRRRAGKEVQSLSVTEDPTVEGRTTGAQNPVQCMWSEVQVREAAP